MSNSEYVVVFITAGSGEEAGLISRVLLEQGKAACINIVEGEIQSTAGRAGLIRQARVS